jgi:hypothetical protein
MQPHLQYTRLVATRNQEDSQMNAITPAHTAEPGDTGRQTPSETCHAVPAEQLRNQEADRLFEARLQWFLAVSRAA